MSTEGYKAISDYGLIGDCHSAALVASDGSIDWCCLPRFDSPSAFADLLDRNQGGHFLIAPHEPYSSAQRYLDDTNVLETSFKTDGGACTLTDFMPLYRDDAGTPLAPRQIVRLLRCQQGTVTLRVDYSPRPDYGRMPTALVESEHGIVCGIGEAETLTLRSPVPLKVSAERATGTITLEEGQEVVFVLTYGDGKPKPAPDEASPLEQLVRTRRFWEEKAQGLEYVGPYRQEMARSYLALHLLTYLPTGAIVAAPTTSLPERIGGVRNWDYRYTWLRDAAFTIDALANLGHMDEARAFFQWLGRVCARYGNDLSIMYRIDAEGDLDEQLLPHLEGYRGSQPVRVGNGAWQQVQHDIYGEVLASAHLLASKGVPINDDQWELLRTLANLAMTRWREPDSGIWEVRGGPYHFVHSKVMCWVALDRAVSLAQMTGRAGPESDTWQATAVAIKEEVLLRGWSERKQAFTQHYDTEAMDASNLLLPLVGFLPPDDPRVASTVRRIREELGEGSFLKRYRMEETDDGLPGGEGAFTLCSFWLVQALAQMGQRAEGRQILQELLKLSNHTGLFSEMVDPCTSEFLGNFPQAFTHIGLVLAARACGAD